MKHKPPADNQTPTQSQGQGEEGDIASPAPADDAAAYARRDREKRDRWERLRKDARGRGLSGPEAIAYANQIVHGPSDADVPPPPARETGVSGLGDIPADWPVLPPNASLQAEIAWVQASRLDVVQETPSGKLVDLSRADTPAPSKAAIGWLETAILFPAKFADVAVKATFSAEHEAEQVRRERLAIDEIRALLREMLPPQAG